MPFFYLSLIIPKGNNGIIGLGWPLLESMSSLMYPFDFRKGQTSNYYLHDYSLGSPCCQQAKTEMSGEVKGRVRTMSRYSKINGLAHGPDSPKQQAWSLMEMNISKFTWSWSLQLRAENKERPSPAGDGCCRLAHAGSLIAPGWASQGKSGPETWSNQMMYQMFMTWQPELWSGSGLL